MQHLKILPHFRDDADLSIGEVCIKDFHDSRCVDVMTLAYELCVPVDRFFYYTQKNKRELCNAFFDGREHDMYHTQNNWYSPIRFEIVDAINQTYVTDNFKALHEKVKIWRSNIEDYTAEEIELIASAWLFTVENYTRRLRPQVEVLHEAIRINHSHGVYDCPYWLIKDAGGPDKLWDRLLKYFVWASDEIKKQFISKTYASTCSK